MASIMSADSLGVGAPGISGSKNDSDNIHEDGKRSFSAAGSTGMKVLQPKAVTMRSSSTSPPDASLSDREEAPVTINATSGSSKPPLPLWAQARPTAAADASVTIAGIGVASSVQSAMSVDSLSEAKESRSKENRTKVSVTSDAPGPLTEDSPREDISDSKDTRNDTEGGFRSAPPSPVSAPVPTTTFSPDDNFVDAEALAMAEHAVKETDTSQHSRQNATDDDVGMSVLSVSAPSPPPSPPLSPLHSSLWYQRGEEVWRARGSRRLRT